MTDVFGDLPCNWQLSRVDRLASIHARIGWKALTAAEYQPEGYAFLSTPNIKSREIDFENVNYVSSFRYEESPELKLQEGDVLLAKDGSTLGIVNTVRNLPRPATVNGSIAILRTFDTDPTFLQYAFASQPLQDKINAAKDGMGVPHLFQRDIKKLPVPVPPAEEQRRIADFLDTETARIDKLISARAKQIESLDERSYAAISETLLPGILTHPLGNSPWPWLPETPPDSPLVKLGYVCEIQTGITVDGNRKVTDDSVTRPYLRVANVQAGYVELDSVTEITLPRAIAARSTLRPGDVLMTEGGDLDKLGRGTVWHGELPNCLHQNHVFALRPDSKRLLGDYLALMTQTLHGRCYFESTGSRTTNLASTNSTKILNFHIPLPSVDKQRFISQRAHGVTNSIEKAKSMLRRQTDLLAERRRALITAAVTGQFDVSTASGRGMGV